MDNQDSDDTWLKLLNDNDIFYEQNFLMIFFFLICSFAEKISIDFLNWNSG